MAWEALSTSLASWSVCVMGGSLYWFGQLECLWDGRLYLLVWPVGVSVGWEAHSTCLASWSACGMGGSIYKFHSRSDTLL